MFLIRRVYDARLPINLETTAKVQRILEQQFPDLSQADVAKLPDQLNDPMKHSFRAVLYVAERSGSLRGFALLLHDPKLGFDYLDFISAAAKMTGRGIGGALYARVRADAKLWKSRGIFMECLPDDPALCADAGRRAQNRARLKFYEQYGARPIVGTKYETPVTPGDDSPPYLVYDGLDSKRPLGRRETRAFVRAVLERKYAHHCPPAYINRVVQSFRDDPVKLRAPRYLKPDAASAPAKHDLADDQKILLVVNDKHHIHHVKVRGYVEAPVRIKSIMRRLEPTGLFLETAARPCADKLLRKVHDRSYVDYLQATCAAQPEGTAVYPYVFPIRNQTRPPLDRAIRAGYYCIDTFTPLTKNVYPAARRAVDCATTAARSLLDGRRLAYALVRPPGHHAERRAYGGFCYFNSAAVAAELLSSSGRVAVLDVDYHHGNGTQNIFFEREDVLTISIHGHPRFAYPYFSGFADETGEGEGEGRNLNIPLPESVDGKAYRVALRRAEARIREHRPTFLVVALGLDTAKGDPTGTWSLGPDDLRANGERLGQLHLPTVVVQEGGYDSRVLGRNARAFFEGLWAGAFTTHVPSVPG